MTLLAQIPTPPTDAFSTFLLCVMALIAAVVLIITGLAHWRQFRTPVVVPAGSEYVRRAEFVRGLRVISRRLRQLDGYTHESIHDLRDLMQAQKLSTEALHRTLLKEVHEMVGTLAEKLEENSKQLAVLSALLERDREADHEPARKGHRGEG